MDQETRKRAILIVKKEIKDHHNWSLIMKRRMRHMRGVRKQNAKLLYEFGQSPTSVSSKHGHRRRMRAYYAALAFLRGRPFSQIENVSSPRYGRMDWQTKEIFVDIVRRALLPDIPEVTKAWTLESPTDREEAA